jgi:serine/threonine protein kinase
MLIVEFLERGTLANRLESGPLAIRDVVNLGIKMTDCIAYLHERGLLHRDIKPSNIGFTAQGTPKLLDFGLSSLVAGGDYQSETAALGRSATGVDATLTRGGIAGTPAYLAPETLRGVLPGSSADVWSLALVLYEAITGINPFVGGDIEDVLARVRTARIPDVRRIRQDCPASLASVLADALAENPDGRPDARPLKERLEGLSEASI